jgi:hypothetical protein
MTMASVSFLSRILARRALNVSPRINQVASLGSVRLSSYYTPGALNTQQRQRIFLVLQACLIFSLTTSFVFSLQRMST